MRYFVNDNGISAADPEAIRTQARQLKNIVSNMDRIVRLLQQVSVRGSWDSPSGETFAAKVADTPGDLIDVANRLRSTAGIIRPYADLLEATQKAVTGYDDDASTAHTTMEDRDAELDVMTPDDPDRNRVARERARAAAALARAERGFDKELQEAHADESRMAAKLSDVSAKIGDPAGYDFWEGLSTLGQNARKFGVIAKPVALVGVAEPIGKAGHRIFYEEGSYKDVAMSSVGYGLDTVGFGAGWLVKGFKSRVAGKGASRVNGPPAARYPKRHHAPLPSKVPASVRDTVRRKAGVDDLQTAFDDWEMVAGEGRVAKVSVLVQHSAKHGRRAYSNVWQTRKVAEKVEAQDRPAHSPDEPKDARVR